MNRYKVYIEYKSVMYEYEEVIEVKADNAHIASYIAMGMIMDEVMQSSDTYVKILEVYTEVIK